MLEPTYNPLAASHVLRLTPNSVTLVSSALHDWSLPDALTSSCHSCTLTTFLAASKISYMCWAASCINHFCSLCRDTLLPLFAWVVPSHSPSIQKGKSRKVFWSKACQCALSFTPFTMKDKYKLWCAYWFGTVSLANLEAPREQGLCLFTSLYSPKPRAAVSPDDARWTGIPSSGYLM